MQEDKQGHMCLPFESARRVFLKPDLMISPTWFKTFAYSRKPQLFQLSQLTFAIGP